MPGPQNEFQLLLGAIVSSSDDAILGKDLNGTITVGDTLIGSLGGPMAVLMPATLMSAVPVETLPPDWLSIRNRWEAFHAARTFISLAGFGSPLVAALWSCEDCHATGV